MNKVFLMGRLTKAPEIRYAGDTPIAKFSIAVDRRYKNQQGEYETDFFNLTAFKKTAEFVEKYLNKGTKVVVEGEIQNNNYEKDGKKIYQDQIIAHNIEFAESRQAQAEGSIDNTGFNQVDETIDESDLPFV